MGSFLKEEAKMGKSPERMETFSHIESIIINAGALQLFKTLSPLLKKNFQRYSSEEKISREEERIRKGLREAVRRARVDGISPRKIGAAVLKGRLKGAMSGDDFEELLSPIAELRRAVGRKF